MTYLSWSEEPRNIPFDTATGAELFDGASFDAEPTDGYRSVIPGRKPHPNLMAIDWWEARGIYAASVKRVGFLDEGALVAVVGGPYTGDVAWGTQPDGVVFVHVEENVALWSFLDADDPLADPVRVQE